MSILTTRLKWLGLVALLQGCLGSGSNAVDGFIADEDELLGKNALVFAPTALNLGNSQKAPSFVESTFVVTNSATKAVFIQDFTIDNTDFSVSTHDCPVSPLPLDAGSSCTVKIRFSPAADGDHAASFKATYGLTASETDRFATSLGLAGRSTADGIGNSGLTFNPTPYDYGDVPLAPSFQERTFQVQNVTAGDVYLSGFSTNSSLYSVRTTSCPTSPLPLAKDATCNVVVRFSPVVAGRHLATLSGTYGTTDLQPGAFHADVALTGSSTPTTLSNPAVTFTPEYWDYGDLGLNVTATKVFTVRNTASSTVFISSIAPAPASTEFQVLTSNCPTGLNPFAAGASCTVTVTYTPTTEGAHTATIATTYGATSGTSTDLTAKLYLTGRSSPAPISSGTLTFTPSFWDYGDVARNTSVSKAIVVKNASASTVYLGAIDRTSPTNFTISHNCPLSPSTLAPNAECTVNLIFIPTADGSYSSDLTVSYGPDAPRSSSVQSKMIVIGRSVSTPIGNAAVTFTPAFKDFGDIAIGTPVTQSVTVTNANTVPIFLSGINASDADFQVFGSNCPTGASSLGASSTCTFNLRYIPSAQGVDNTDVVLAYGLDQVRNNNLNRTMVALGRSTPGGTGLSAFAFSPDYWDFGDVAQGITAQKAVTITNSSTDPVYISNVTRTNATVFGVSHDCPVSPTALAAGGVCTVVTSFTPAADGIQNSLVSVVYGPDAPRAGNLNAKFAIAGRSTAATRGNPSLAYNPTYWDFGDVPRNTFQDKSITITNGSTAGVYISSVNLDNAGSFLITSNNCPSGSTPLAAAANCQINVRFSPTADTVENVTVRAYYGPDQARSGNLVATSIVSGRSIAVPAGQAIFSATPSFFDFGDVAQSNSTTQNYVVTNTSGANVYISGVTRSNVGAFTVSHNCPTSPTALANNASCTVTLGFAPNAEGPHSTRVDITHGVAAASSTNLTYSVYGQGRSTSAATGNSSLQFSPTSWDFGDIAAGVTATKSITVTNAGSAGVYLGSLTSDNARFTTTASTCPTGATPLNAGANCTFTARFLPTTDGGESATLTHRYGPDQTRSGNLLANLSVFGRSTAAPLGNTAITYTPNYWDFGDVANGQTSTRVFSVRNAYSAGIYLSSFTSSDPLVTLSDDCPRSPTALAPAATCNLTAVYAPLADGSHASNIKAYFGPDAARSTNLEALLTVAGRSTSVADGNPIVTFNPTYRDFGNILVGQNASGTFTVANSKTTPIFLGSASIANTDYAITANTCPTVTALAGSSSCSVTVRYTPTAEESDIDYLAVTYGPDAARRTNLVSKATLIAKSEPPPVGNAALVLTPNTYDFQSVALSPAFADVVLTVSNSSARNLYFGAMTGLAAPYSVQSTTCPSGATALAAGAACSITVRFSPIAGAQVTGTLQVNYGVSSSATSDYNSQAQFTGRSNPNPPTNFAFTAGNGTSAAFSWDANDFDQASFEIERCDGVSCASTFPSSDPVIPGNVVRLSSITNTTRAFLWNAANTSGQGLTEGQVYRFRIRGVAGSTRSAWLTSPPIIAFGGLASVDNSTGLTSSLSQINCNSATAAGSYVGLYWNSVGNAAYYQIFDMESGTAKFVRNVDAPASSTVLTGLTAGVNKSYLVRAFTEAGVASINATPSALTTVSYTPCAVIGQSGPGNWNMSNGMLNPRAMWVDTTTTPKRLFVADQNNHRVLIWNSIPTSNATPADVVVGQPDFHSFLANNSGDRTAPAIRSSKSLNSPQGVFAKNGKLYVVDSGNHRVLIWNSIPTTNFAPADVVLGQVGFITATAVGTTNCNAGNSAQVMNSPNAVFVDNANMLYVVDRANHRVLVWNSIPTANRAAADIVLGSTFAGSCPAASTTQATFNAPETIYVSNNDVFIGDRGNRRIMRFVKPLTSGMNASNYWGGHGNFTTVAAQACSSTRFNDPIGIWGDDVTGSANIYVADYGQHRVMRFASNNWGNDPVADSVIGQANLTSCGANDTSTTSRNPIAGFALNSIAAEGGVWTLSYGGHRINRYGYTAANSNQPTSNLILGQPRYSTLMSNIGPVNDNKSIVRTMGISIGNSGPTPRMAVSDFSANRVFLYDNPITGHLPAASRVLGQTSYSAVDPNQGSTVASNTFNTPAGVWTDGIRLLVADPTNHRVLGWRTWPTADTQAASFVLGQSQFTNSGAAASSTGLNYPLHVFVSDYPGSPSYKYIWVADTNNNRVVAYQTNWSTSPADPVAPPSAQSAVLVLGQSIFTTNPVATTQAGMRGPRGVWSDGTRVVVADTINHRVLIWDGATTPTSGQNADIVLGQPDFVSNTANNGGLSASSMNFPVGVWVDASGRLYVADNNNHRILVWDTFPTASAQPADRVIGQTTFFTNAINAGVIYPASQYFQYPAGLWMDAGRLFVTDGLNINNVAPNTTTNNRITVFPGF